MAEPATCNPGDGVAIPKPDREIETPIITSTVKNIETVTLPPATYSSSTTISAFQSTTYVDSPNSLTTTANVQPSSGEISTATSTLSRKRYRGPQFAGKIFIQGDNTTQFEAPMGTARRIEQQLATLEDMSLWVFTDAGINPKAARRQLRRDRKGITSGGAIATVFRALEPDDPLSPMNGQLIGRAFYLFPIINNNLGEGIAFAEGIRAMRHQLESFVGRMRAAHGPEWVLDVLVHVTALTDSATILRMIAGVMGAPAIIKYRELYETVLECICEESQKLVKMEGTSSVVVEARWVPSHLKIESERQSFCHVMVDKLATKAIKRRGCFESIFGADKNLSISDCIFGQLLPSFVRATYPVSELEEDLGGDADDEEDDETFYLAKPVNPKWFPAEGSGKEILYDMNSVTRVSQRKRRKRSR